MNSASVDPASLLADTFTLYQESTVRSLIKYFDVSPLIGDESADQSRELSDLKDTMKNLIKHPPDSHSFRFNDKQDAFTSFRNDDCDGAIGTVWMGI